MGETPGNEGRNDVKVNLHKKARVFSPLEGIELKDMGTISLAPDEQLTIETDSGKSNDIVRKEWGFYLSNSVNWNLKKQDFKTAVVVSFASVPSRIYINLVEVEKMNAFREYLSQYDAKVICWLDDWFDEEG